MTNVCRIASRKSDLARCQAFLVGDALVEQCPDLKVEYIFKEAPADVDLKSPLWNMPETGVFTSFLHSLLLNNEADIVVHSWKDLPIDGHEGTEIIATLNRDDVRDLLLIKKDYISSSMKILSSSPRRMYNLSRNLPSLLNVENVDFSVVRGNVQTRLRKFIEDETAGGLVVAKAAIDRLISSKNEEFRATRDYISSIVFNENIRPIVLPLSLNPAAAGQGAIGIEIKTGQEETELYKLLKNQINSVYDYQNVLEEKSILGSYGGGCHQKIGCSILSKSIGFLEGLTDEGVELSRDNLNRPGQVNKLNIFKSNKLPLFSSRERLEINVEELQNKNIRLVLICKYDGLSETIAKYLIENKLPVITSGVTTWKTIASEYPDLNIIGTIDSIGEDNEYCGITTFLSVITGNGVILKITHEDSIHIQSYTEPLIQSGSNLLTNLENCATYRLCPNEKVDCAELLSILKKEESIYWSSASSFLQFIEVCGHSVFSTKLSHLKHYCGAGTTYKVISRLIPTVEVCWV